MHNAVYIGRLELGKTYRPNYKVKRPFPAAKENWICYDNAHEAIISKAEYDIVQRITALDVQRSPQMETVYP